MKWTKAKTWEEDAEGKRRRKWFSGKREKADERGGKMKELKRRIEIKQQKKTIASPHYWNNNKPDTSFHQTKVFISIPVSSSSLNVDILQYLHPGSPMLCFLSMFDKGDHGGWSSVGPGASVSLMQECCLFAAVLSRTVWKHISGLSSACFLKDQSSFFPHRSTSTFLRSITQTHTANQKKNKVGSEFPQWMINLTRAVFLIWDLAAL